MPKIIPPEEVLTRSLTTKVTEELGEEVDRLAARRFPGRKGQTSKWVRWAVEQALAAEKGEQRRR